ncbi:MAG: hypothetical protein R3F61_33920 [Myxococcota bacterium]
MSQLVARPTQLPGPLLGSRSDWRRDAALVGFVTAYGGAALGMFGLSLHPWLLACGAAGAVLGALLGETAPFVLERARRHAVPLPVLAVALPVVAAAMATSIAVSAAWMVGAPLTLSVKFAMVAAAMQVALFWLPYTMAMVLRAPRWPIVAGACLVAPLSGPLAKWLILSVF